MKTEYFTCCGSPEHIMRVQVGTDDDWNVSIDIQLSSYRPWHKRCWIALKYVFGYTEGTYWEEVMLHSDDVKRLQNILGER